MTTLDQKQVELILAMIKRVGIPSGKDQWQEIADAVTDNPSPETCRSRWRGIEAKMKNALAANNVEKDATVPVKKPKHTTSKKTAKNESSVPTVKEPRAKTVDEDYDEGGDNANTTQIYEDNSATAEKRTFDEYANDGASYGYSYDNGDYYDNSLGYEYDHSYEGQFRF